MLLRFGQRAPTYDRENRFFHEDFEELRAAGYLKLAIPEDLGGLGFSLAEVAEQQRRLAYRAPATALAINMHIYWTGVAADLRRMGDSSLEWILREAAAGEVFAAGHGEAGNDLPLFLSTAKAERADGGYRFYGHKMFGSLTPVWTRLGAARHGHQRSSRAEDRPRVHAARYARAIVSLKPGTRWACAPRAATTPISKAPSFPIGYIARILPAGALDPFIGAVFANALLNFGAIYYAIAERARDLAITSARKRTSLARQLVRWPITPRSSTCSPR